MLHILIQLLSAAFLWMLCHLTAYKWLKGILLAVAALDLITIPFGVIVLRQRLREIEQNEMDQARKY